VQPLVDTGARLDDRYRLGQALRTHDGVTLWQATDEVLDRTVGVLVISGQTKAQVKALGDAVARAGQCSDARWVRVLDVGSESVDRRQTAWVITEWVDAPSLAATLHSHPLRAPVATWVVMACAQAVDAAHRAGAEHRHLHPGEVLLPVDASPRLTGLELRHALRGETSSASGTAPSYDDTRGLGALLYACLTGRWPLTGWTGLPIPSRGDGVHPREQRRGVPRDIDEITARALTGGYAEPAALVRDLATLPTAPLHPPAPDPEEMKDRRWMRIAWRVVPPLLVAVVGWVAWTLGSDLGKVPSPARSVTPVVAQPHQHGGNDAQQVVWSKPPNLSSFDPQGDGTEDPGGVGLAVDDDPSTEWTTDTYHDNPQLGGLKPGVGLLLDLGRPKQVQTANLLLSAPGADLQIRAGDAPPRQATDLPVVASRTDAPTSTHLKLATTVTARYWLVWITSLPKYGSDYRLGIAEIALQH
jgi:hypothetical protein